MKIQPKVDLSKYGFTDETHNGSAQGLACKMAHTALLVISKNKKVGNRQPPLLLGQILFSEPEVCSIE